MSPYFQRPIELGADIVHALDDEVHQRPQRSRRRRRDHRRRRAGGPAEVPQQRDRRRSEHVRCVHVSAQPEDAGGADEGARVQRVRGGAVSRSASEDRVGALHRTAEPSAARAREAADVRPRRHADVQRRGRSRRDAAFPAVGAGVRAGREPGRRRVADRTSGDHDAREFAAGGARFARHRRQPGAAVGRHRSRSGSAARSRSRACGV